MLKDLKSLKEKEHKNINGFCLTVFGYKLHENRILIFKDIAIWTASSEFGTYRLCEQ